MKNHTVRTPKGTPLMRIGRATERKVHVSRAWYNRTRRSGKTIYFSLGRNWNEACTKADEIDGFLRLPSTRLVEAIERFGRNAKAKSPKVASIGAVLESLASHADGLSLAPSSLKAYRLCLLRLVRVGLSHRFERPVSLDEARAETPLVLTPRLVLDYKEAVIKGRSGSKNALSAKRSMNSVLRNAKAVFSPAAREVYASDGLIVPDLTPFLATLPFRRVGIDYALPSTELVNRVMSLIAMKPDNWDDQVHTMSALAALAGLRKSEICFARWSWLHGGSAPYIERYEAETLPKRPRISGVDMLRYVLDENGLGGDDLAKIIGVDRSVAYRILKGERGLTADHIKALCERFGVSADVFIR